MPSLPHRDVVIIGFGWTGAIMAQELTDAGLDVIALERGPWRNTSDLLPNTAQDELRYRIRHELFLRPSQSTFTFRNKMDQQALPVRKWGAFMPPNGVGGGGVHWNAETWRFLPSDFVLRTHLTQRYGAKFLPSDMTIQDWGVTYADLEPHYDRFEYLCGISGTAGNLRGQIQEGGNPFEGPRSRPYPNPAQQQPYSHTLFAEGARKLGYKPFPQPSGNMSQAYVNPLGVRLAPCTYCGFCEWFQCANYSKASPQTTILPVLLRKSNFTLRSDSEVTRINVDSSGKRATGVTFVDADGTEWEQPADLVILAAYSIFNVQMLLHSRIGKPYDPQQNTGVIGRNFTHQCISDVIAFFDPAKYRFNPFMSSGAIGMCIDEFNGDNFDHGPHGFVGGGYMGNTQTNGRPIETTPVPEGTPKWGERWKRAVKESYQSAIKPGTGVHGSMYSYRDVYVDLDPTYTDRFKRPLPRITMDFHDNEIRQNAYLTDRFAEIFVAMGAQRITKEYRKGPYDMTRYQTTHLNGGAIMGANPRDSALNRYLQSWDVSNLFVLGASAFPQNAGYNPTGTVAALAYWAADAIRSQYLKNPSPLVHA
jgi:gluconate 2-dehydrogenase alpha chain